MNLHFENPHVIMAVLALLSTSAACLFTLYLRDERRRRRAAVRLSPMEATRARIDEKRKSGARRRRPAA